MDKNRLISGQIFDEDYFEHLISEIQEIRASERCFYQKVTDIYATAVDYSVDSQITRAFLLAKKQDRDDIAKGRQREGQSKALPSLIMCGYLTSS